MLGANAPAWSYLAQAYAGRILASSINIPSPTQAPTVLAGVAASAGASLTGETLGGSRTTQTLTTDGVTSVG